MTLKWCDLRRQVLLAVLKLCLLGRADLGHSVVCLLCVSEGLGSSSGQLLHSGLEPRDAFGLLLHLAAQVTGSASGRVGRRRTLGAVAAVATAIPSTTALHPLLHIGSPGVNRLGCDD